MDQNSLKAADVCGPLKISEQTLRHWRSKGVPERRIGSVNYFMATWNKPSPDLTAAVGQTLVLTPTEEQFERWNQAANEQHSTIKQWALEGLDRLAAVQFPLLKVAEEERPYPNPAKKNSAS